MSTSVVSPVPDTRHDSLLTGGHSWGHWAREPCFAFAVVVPAHGFMQGRTQFVHAVTSLVRG